ncbi:MAG: RNA-binding protein [Polaromonas sp.]
MNAFDNLRHYKDVATLKPALHRLCEQFGRIARLDVLTAAHEGTRQAICFLKMESAEKEHNLMKTLGVGRFGGEIVFVVDMNVAGSSEEDGPSSQWAELEDFQDAFSSSGTTAGKRDFLEPRPPLGAAH